MNKGFLSVSEWHDRFVQQSQWTSSIRNYLFPKINLGSNSRVLEVGCGTCAILSQVLPQLENRVGIDIDLDFLIFAKNNFSGLHLTLADGSMLPHPSGVFDVVFCHYLLLWLKEPIPVLKEFYRVAKPGAKVIFLAEPDYGGRIDFPETSKFLGDTQTKSLQEQGADPFIGRKLKALAKTSGFKLIEQGVLGSQTGDQFNQDLFESEWDILSSDLAHEFASSDLEKFRQVELQAWLSGTRVQFVPTFYLVAQKLGEEEDLEVIK